jgi:serine phosphatase RsbU (regulator of sigma subunit)
VGYLGIRHNRSKGLLALPAVLLVAAGHVQWVFNALHVPAGFQPFGIDVHFYQLGTMAALLMFTVRLLQRFFRGQRERDQLQQEMEQARQVQQILVPDAMPALPAFTVESEYRSARHVGGDFFQILPEDDNSLLLIIGGVSGKGLKSAMLVSMIVGAIRVVVDHAKEPIKILEDLNRHLCGRIGQQFATCLVVRIAADGRCIVANAGHLAPYHNGCEVPLAGSMPLGLVEGADFEQVGLTLEPGDRLVMITDGIVEATDAKQQLFGFERTMELVGRSHSAAEVAAATQRFGQEDDITVLSLVRTA